MIYELSEDPQLQAPVLLTALSGWVDAAAAGTTAAAHLARDGREIATFDGDQLFDYRSQRPILDIVDGVMTKSVWPEVVVRHSNVGGRDLLVLTGMEPDLAWRRFAEGVAELAVQLGVTQLLTLGSVPGPVPHTLPPPILTTASDKDLLTGDERPPAGLLRVPAAAVSIVDQYVAQAGIPTVGFFVQVPHYVSGTFPSGVLALVGRIAAHLELDLSLGTLEEEAKEHRRQLDEIVAGQPEAEEHVRALEAMQEEQKMVSGEELANEIERYLRDASPGDKKRFDEGNSPS
jgi:hypothetical protein